MFPGPPKAGTRVQKRERPTPKTGTRVPKNRTRVATLIAWYIPPNSWMAPKSIGEGASSLFGGRPGSLENASCSRATPDLHRCNLEVALEQETFSRLPGLHPKRPLAPSPIDLGEVQEFRHCTRVSGSQNEGTENRNEGTFAKPPFYQTTLLFPLKLGNQHPMYVATVHAETITN